MGGGEDKNKMPWQSNGSEQPASYICSIDKSSPFVRGASFAGMFAADADTGARLTSADLAASTTLVSVEKLTKGEKLCVGLGRWSPRNEIEGGDMNTVHFTVRKM